MDSLDTSPEPSSHVARQKVCENEVVGKNLIDLASTTSHPRLLRRQMRLHRPSLGLRVIPPVCTVIHTMRGLILGQVQFRGE